MPPTPKPADEQSPVPEATPEAQAPAPVTPPQAPEAPVEAPVETPSAGSTATAGGTVPDGHNLSVADDPNVDATVNAGSEDLGAVVWMEHDGVEGKTQTTQVQFDTVWAPREWKLTDAPVEEIGSVPGA